MSTAVLIVTDSEPLSHSIRTYLDVSIGNGVDVMSRYYLQRDPLPGEFYRKADLLIFGLFGRDDIGYRAEGLLTAIARTGDMRRVLVISGCVVADRLDCDWYWDLAAKDTLSERVTRLLTMPPAPPSAYDPVKREFSAYCRPAVDRHRIMRRG